VFVSLVTETFPPDINGVSTTLERLHGAMLGNGHRCQVICARGGSPRELQDGFEVPSLSLPFYPDVRLGLPVKKRLEAIWRDELPDIVHIATEGPLGWAAQRVASRLGLPVSSSLHTNFHTYASHYHASWLARPVMRYLRDFHNRTALTFIPTAEQARSLAELGFKRLKVMGRGVDARLFSPDRRCERLRAEWGAKEDTPVVLFVGRLAAEKNLTLLMECFEAMRATRPDCCFVVVGDGPERKRLEARLPGVVFAGMRRDEELARYYASADWFIFPSKTETFGNVLLEAMASGLPSLSFNYAAGAQLVREGENGYLIELGEDEQFVLRARELVSELGIPSKAMRMRARETAMAHDWQAIQSTFEQTLAQVVDDWRLRQLGEFYES